MATPLQPPQEKEGGPKKTKTKKKTLVWAARRKRVEKGRFCRRIKTRNCPTVRAGSADELKRGTSSDGQTDRHTVVIIYRIQIKNIFCILHLGRHFHWLFLNLKIIIPSFWGLCLHTMVLTVIILKLREVPESMWFFSFDHLDYNSLYKDSQMVTTTQWILSCNNYNKYCKWEYYHKLRYLFLNLLTSC